MSMQEKLMQEKTMMTALLRLNKLRYEDDISDAHKAEITEIINLLLMKPQPDCPWK